MSDIEDQEIKSSNLYFLKKTEAYGKTSFVAEVLLSIYVVFFIGITVGLVEFPYYIIPQFFIGALYAHLISLRRSVLVNPIYKGYKGWVKNFCKFLLCFITLENEKSVIPKCKHIDSCRGKYTKLYFYICIYMCIHVLKNLTKKRKFFSLITAFMLGISFFVTKFLIFKIWFIPLFLYSFPLDYFINRGSIRDHVWK